MSPKTFLFLAILVLLPFSAQAGSLSVGRMGCEYVNLAEAIEAASPGDTIEVHSGTYCGNVVVDKPLILRGIDTGAGKPVVSAEGTGSAITLSANGIQLEGFIFEGSGFGKAGIEIRSDDNLIKDNQATSNKWHGIFIDGSNNNIIVNNTVFENKYGIWVTFGASNNRICGNDFVDNVNRDATDAGVNWWDGNLYGDFDESDSTSLGYRIPGGLNVDRNPQVPIRENVFDGAAQTDICKGDERDTKDLAIDIPIEVAEEGASFEVVAEETSARENANETIGGENTNEHIAEELRKNENIGLPPKMDFSKDVEEERIGEAVEGKAVVEPVKVGDITAVPEETGTGEIYTATYWLGRGDRFKAEGRHENAIKCYDKALWMEPQLAVAWNNRGVSLTKLGRFEEALKCYEKAIDADSKLAEAWKNKGDVLQMMSRFNESLACYDNAIDSDPKFAEAWNCKGKALNRLGRFEEALKCFDEAINVDPQYADAWYNKSWAFQLLDRDEEAKTAFDLARRLGYS